MRTLCAERNEDIVTALRILNPSSVGMERSKTSNLQSSSQHKCYTTTSIDGSRRLFIISAHQMKILGRIKKYIKKKTTQQILSHTSKNCFRLQLQLIQLVSLDPSLQSATQQYNIIHEPTNTRDHKNPGAPDDPYHLN